jgi:hypothetical protein
MFIYKHVSQLIGNFIKMKISKILPFLVCTQLCSPIVAMNNHQDNRDEVEEWVRELAAMGLHNPFAPNVEQADNKMGNGPVLPQADLDAVRYCVSAILQAEHMGNIPDSLDKEFMLAQSEEVRQYLFREVTNEVVHAGNILILSRTLVEEVFGNNVDNWCRSVDINNILTARTSDNKNAQKFLAKYLVYVSQSPSSATKIRNHVAFLQKKDAENHMTESASSLIP